jgi:AbrB family looped-hinge helix DNA binding protein
MSSGERIIDGMEKPKPLTGKALLQRLNEIGHVTRKEAARLCGYYRITASGEVKTDLSKFYSAILQAQGLELEPQKGADHRDGRGRSPSYRVTVHQNGQIVIGAAYTKAMNLKPGDTFLIKRGYKHIHLYQLEDAALDGVKPDTTNPER